MQRMVQLKCLMTFVVQTEILEFSGNAVCHVTFPHSGPKLK